MPLLISSHAQVSMKMAAKVHMLQSDDDLIVVQDIPENCSINGPALNDSQDSFDQNAAEFVWEDW